MNSRYDHIVVGAGASGLAAALLLGLNGRSVLLLEKAPHLGGSLSRFTLKGIPFDTGFHFTGGFSEGGLLDDMLSVLGLRDGVQPVFLDPEVANRFVFEQTGETFDFPAGQPLLTEKLAAAFPGERGAVERYFQMVERVRRKTITMDIRHIDCTPEPMDEDFMTLQCVLDGLTGNAALKALLSGFAMCYGTPPNEISFAAHSRMCHGLYDSVARVQRGGDAFVDAFGQALQHLDIDVACGTQIEECLDLDDRKIGRVRLSSGAEVAFGSGVFTIHPQEILRLLPQDGLSPAFVHRVQAFEASAGFFTLFGLGRDEDAGSGGIVSLFPSMDVNAMLDAQSAAASAIVMMRTRERIAGVARHTVTAFEPCFAGQTVAWSASHSRRRPAGYAEWKAARTARMRERIAAAFPGQALQVIDSASPLTFRDYLFSPDGSAYGIKQKMGQFNLIGRLPWRNLYAAGQSALLPGIVGAMMSAFIVVRSLLGRAELSAFINRKLDE